MENATNFWKDYVRASDEAEALASLEAEYEAARHAALVLAGAEPLARSAALIEAFAHGLSRGETPAWELLSAAEQIVSDLRVEHGCEDWETADWSRPVVQDLAYLDAAARDLRERAVREREARLRSAEALLREMRRAG